MEGLTDVIMKRNIPFAEYPTYKKIKELGKTVGGFSNVMSELYEVVFNEACHSS